jgi:hypothetical protein
MGGRDRRHDDEDRERRPALFRAHGTRARGDAHARRAPHSVPVWAGVEDDLIAFFSIAGSRKDENIGADPRVALSVTDPDNDFDMAFVRGRVVRRLDGDDAMPIVDRIAEKYTGAPYSTRSGMAVFLVQPEVTWSHDYAAG